MIDSQLNQLLGKLYTYERHQLIFVDDFCDFNGNASLTNKKTKENHKYYVYNRNTAEPVYVENEKELTIIDIVKDKDFQVIFFIDSHHRLSFVKAKYHKVLSVNDIIDKIEKTPFFRVGLFGLFQSLFIFGVLRFRFYSFEGIDLSFGYDKSINAKVHFLFPQKLRAKYSMKTEKWFLLFHLFWCRIPFNLLLKHYLENSDINVPGFIKIKNERFNYYFSLKKWTRDKYNRKHYVFNTLSHSIWKSSVELFIRKSITGQYVIVFTSPLELRVKMKEKVAYFCSLFAKSKETYNIYFEKFCEGASESGFELFKYAVTEDERSIFILDTSSDHYKNIKETYPKQVVAKNSFKAFYRIFLANSFLSSDLVSHIQRRLYDNDSLIKRKILSNNKKVFLQHGVCLATNVFERGYYNIKVPIAPDFIAVSSQKEKNMFLKHTDYNGNQLIKTGLPNLDLYVHTREELKDEITFLLTWRPWDLTGKIEEGSYLGRYRQFIQLVNENNFYQGKKINIVLHPKSKLILKEQFPDFYHENKHHFYDGDIKDALLRSKVLISDYSSVTFFAFSGGSNVVFYWEDKERAEKEYGSPNILQKNIAFGKVIYRFNEMQQAIEESYHSEQSSEYKKIFNHLVECQDGENTKNTYEYIRKNIFGTPNNNNILKTKRFNQALDMHLSK